MSSPIPFMVRRARLIRGETQREFAIHLGVDQGSISRWERGKSEPTSSKLDEIRKIITTAEPSYSRAYIKASPTLKHMCQRDNFLKSVVLSRGLAELIGVDPDDIIRNPESYTSYIKEGEGIHRLNEAVQSDARWKRGEIAFFEARYFAPILGEWVRAIGAPLAEANAALLEGVIDPNAKEEFWIKFTPFGEIDDAA